MRNSRIRHIDSYMISDYLEEKRDDLINSLIAKLEAVKVT